MTQDLGYSVERCKSGLRASEALAVGARGEKTYWNRRVHWWAEQLALAMLRERPLSGVPLETERSSATPSIEGDTG